MNMFRRASFLFFVLCPLISNSLSADVFHYKNLLVGDRAATMGGAYGAVADDVSGYYYNPAGTVYAPSDSVSGSANTYQVTETKYKDVIYGTQDWDRESANLLPNFFGILKKFGDKTAGFSYVVTDALREHQDQSFQNDPEGLRDDFILNLHREDTTYLIGPSFSFELSDTLSAGVSLYYYNRVFRQQFNQTVFGILASDADSDGTADTDSAEWTYDNQTLEELGYKPIIGFMWTPAEKFTVGFVWDQTTLTESVFVRETVTKAEDTEVVEYSKTFNNDQRVQPTHMNLSFAYFPSPFMVIALDFDYYESNTDLYEDILNIAFGMEYFTSESHAFRFGFYTNYDARKTPDSSTTGEENIDIFGTTLGYSYYTGVSSITFGLGYAQGSGQSQIFGDSVNYDVETTAYSFILAASQGF